MSMSVGSGRSIPALTVRMARASNPRGTAAFTHTEEGFAKTLARLRKHGDPADLPVAIATTRGLAVDRLLAAGHPIVPVHPNAFHAMRARWGASKAKIDAGDRMKLADYLRTDGHMLPRLEPTEQATLELQALTRTRADHVEAKVAAVNQLAALLDAHWPGAKAVFFKLDSDIALAFLERYPTPAAAAKLTAGRLQAWCKRHHYSGHKPGSVHRTLALGTHRRIPPQRERRRAAHPRPDPAGQGYTGNHPHTGQRDRRRGGSPPLRAAVRHDAAHRHDQPWPGHR